MKSLVVEDEFTSRMQIQYFLAEYGSCHIAVNGQEALEAYRKALDEQAPYDLICLDIKLPGMDGQEVLKTIREIEEAAGESIGTHAKIFMTTALTDAKNVSSAFYQLCDEYLKKPVDKKTLQEKLLEHKLI